MCFLVKTNFLEQKFSLSILFIFVYFCLNLVGAQENFVETKWHLVIDHSPTSGEHATGKHSSWFQSRFSEDLLTDSLLPTLEETGNPWRFCQPMPVFLPGDSIDRGAWWTTFHSVAQSWTQSWTQLNDLALTHRCQELFYKAKSSVVYLLCTCVHH